MNDQLPQDREAEDRIIGTVLAFPDEIGNAGELSIDDFLYPETKQIWGLCLALKEEHGILPDAERVKTTLRTQLKSDAEPLCDLIDTWVEAVPHAGRTAYYVQRVQDAAQKRRDYMRAKRLVELAADPAHPPKSFAVAVQDLAEEQRLKTPPTTTAFVQFPVEVLPEPFRDVVAGGVESLGVNQCMVAVPILAACSGVIGNTFQVAAKDDWTEPLMVFIGVVAKSGTGKSPAMKLAMEPLKKLERELWLQFDQEMALFSELPKAERGDAPTPARLLVSDATTESLPGLLEKNPRGFTMHQEELAAFLNGLDMYRNGKGVDRPRYLTIYDGEPLRVDRKNPNCPSVFVPRPYVSIVGGIQPGILAKCISGDDFESGLMGRFLWAYPPDKVVEPSDKSVRRDVARRYSDAIHRLSKLAPKDAEFTPNLLPLDQAARDEFFSFQKRCCDHMQTADDNRRSALSKLPKVALRLAGLLELMKWAATAERFDVSPDAVSAATMTAAIRLAEWFHNETRRVYELLRGNPDGERLDTLLEKIQTDWKGRCTVKQVAGLRQYRRRKGSTTAAAKADLAQLVRDGRLVTRLESPPDGNPETFYELVSSPSSLTA